MHPECPDYDLCERCEASPFPVHSEDHPMLKAKTPLRAKVTSVWDASGKLAITTSGIFSSAVSRSLTRGRDSRVDDSCGSGLTLDGNAYGVHQTTGQGDAINCSDTRLGPCGIKHVSLTTQRGPSERRMSRENQASNGSAAEKSVAVEGEPLGDSDNIKAIYDVDDSICNLASPISPDNLTKAEAELEIALEATKSFSEGMAQVESGAIAGFSPSTPKRPVPTPLDLFSWVRHVTIPTGCMLPAGAEFTKTWALKHFASGQEFDAQKVRLVLKSNGVLGEACNSVVQFDLVEVEDLQEFEVSIHGLKVPNMPGCEIVEFWRFEDDAGVIYGQPLRLR